MNKAQTVPNDVNAERCSEDMEEHTHTVLLWLMYAGKDRWLIADWNEAQQYWMIIPGWEEVDKRWLTYWKPY
jgi:hypothetical protein